MNGTYILGSVNALWNKYWQNPLQRSLILFYSFAVHAALTNFILYFHYLRFPVHSYGTYDAHDKNGDGANNSDVIHIAVNNPKSFRLQEIVQRIAESDGVHRRGHNIRKCEHDADGSPKFWTQWARDDVVHPAYKNRRSLLTTYRVSLFISCKKFLWCI